MLPLCFLNVLDEQPYLEVDEIFSGLGQKFYIVDPHVHLSNVAWYVIYVVGLCPVFITRERSAELSSLSVHTVGIGVMLMRGKMMTRHVCEGTSGHGL